MASLLNLEIKSISSINNRTFECKFIPYKGVPKLSKIQTFKCNNHTIIKIQGNGVPSRQNSLIVLRQLKTYGIGFLENIT